MEDTRFDQERAVRRAMYLFWDKGYANTSLKQLLQKMDILNGSFYNTFKSKKKLFLLVLKAYEAQVLNPRMHSFFKAPDFSSGLRAFFYHMNRDYSHAELPSGCLVVNSLDTVLCSDPELARAIKGIVGQLNGFLKREICLALEKGALSSELNPQLTADVLTTFAEGLSKASLSGASLEGLNAQTDYFLEALGL